MRKLTRYAIWLLVFSVPWGIVQAVFGTTSITRFLGLGAIGLGILTSVAQRRVHKPGPIFWMATVFFSFAMISQLWSIAPAASSVQLFTSLQVLGLIWLMGEFVRKSDEHDSLFLAFWCGAFVLAADLLWNFTTQQGVSRYSATDFNPNYVGLTLVVGFPMAWRTCVSRRGMLRVLAYSFVIVAPIALMLTGSRSSILAGCALLGVLSFSGRRLSFSSLLPTGAIAVSAIAIALVVPPQTWERVLSIKSDIESGYVGGRGEIWAAGWAVFMEDPILGSGVGTFPNAITPVLEKPKAGHNTVLTLLVELGVVGLTLFGALLVTCVWTIVRLPPREGKFWAALFVALFIIGMAADSHLDKTTWVLFGLLATQRGRTAPRDVTNRVRAPLYRTTPLATAGAHGLVAFKQDVRP